MGRKIKYKHTAEQIIEALNACKGNKAAAARLLRVPNTSMNDLMRRNDVEIEEQPVKWEETRRESDWTIICDTDVARTPEEAFVRCGADAAVWYIAEVKQNEWNMTGRVKTTERKFGKKVDGQKQLKKRKDGITSEWTSEFGRFTNRQMKITLKRRIPEATAEAVNIITDRMRRVAPKWPKVVRHKADSDEKLMYEISIIDHHFGKLGWEPESGENYDLNIAYDRYLAAVHELASCVNGRQIDQVTFVVGHDLLHSEGSSGETVHGTPQDCDGRWQKMYLKAYGAVTYGIEYFAAHVAKCNVVVIPGNHDKTTTFYLGHALAERYRGSSDILVDNEPASRKKVRWGVVLLGLCHGGYKDDPREQELPLDMAQQWKKDWAETEWREWHLGDRHHRAKSHTPSRSQMLDKVDTSYQGVVVRRLPSLCGTDAWHFGKAFRGTHSSEAYLWSDVRGPRGSFTVPMLEDEAINNQ